MKIKKQQFKEQRFVVGGMGQAGPGIITNIYNMLIEEGQSDEEAKSKLYPFDIAGLLLEDTPGLNDTQKRFARKRSDIVDWKLTSPNVVSFKDTIVNAKPSVLIGVTATTGLFDDEVLSYMAKNQEQPVILALSNPTSKSECTPMDVVRVTFGKGLVACGSPFSPFEFSGKSFSISQCNNLYIFPGIGLGALISRATKITTKMFLVASKAISEMVSQEQLEEKMLLPDLNDIREVSFHVAKAVALEARDSGLGRLLSDDDYGTIIKKAQWIPEYYPFRPPK